jgi:hypothetical protein
MRYNADALKKPPVYRARRRNRPSSRRGIRGGAVNFFGRAGVCTIQSTKCEASAAALPPPVPAPCIFPAARFCRRRSIPPASRAVARRRAVDPPRPRLLPAPSPRAVAPTSWPDGVTRDAAAALSLSPASLCTAVAMASSLLSTWRRRDARRFASKVCASAGRHHF